MGYLVSPYSYANGAPGTLPVAMVSHFFFTMVFKNKVVYINIILGFPKYI